MNPNSTLFKKTWKLWIGFAILIGIFIILEKFGVRFPEWTIYIVLGLIILIYVYGYSQIRKSNGGR